MMRVAAFIALIMLTAYFCCRTNLGTEDPPRGPPLAIYVSVDNP